MIDMKKIWQEMKKLSTIVKEIEKDVEQLSTNKQKEKEK